ncbi:MAG TPA: hypothetical protein VFC79_03330 [Tissierellaceae bacterium]|nr:hypothetical protein [Tissierellaceae bacterium]
MKEGWIMYRCTVCRKVFMLLIEEVRHSEEESRQIRCPYFGGHRGINVIGRIDKYGEIHKCMDHDSYERVGRRIRQIK